MNMTYNNAFAETLFIIKCLPDADQNKISKKLINFLEENKNDEYIVNINPDVGLQNQNLLEETKQLLKEIYLTYFTSTDQKQKIAQYDKYISLVEEDLKRQKYDYNRIFKNKESSIVDDNDNIQNTMTEYKESFLKRLFAKIKRFFKK